MKKYSTIVYFTLLSSFASLLNYVTYPLLARALSAMQFINITVALSLLTQMAAFLSSIVAISVGLSKSTERDTTQTIEKLQAILFQLFFVLIFLFVLLSPLFLKSIKLPPLFLLPICLLLLFSIPIAIISGYLNGHQKLIKLGFVAVFSSSLQFILSVITGYITRSGSLALGAMSIGQVLAVFGLYILYRSEKLPRLTTIFKYKINHFNRELRSLALYTMLVSVGIMIISLLQILDLLLVQNHLTDAQVYTDLYIISRVVFFAGTIFIWPFLSKIDIHDYRQNTLPFGQLCILLTCISGFAITLLISFNHFITHLLFNREYDSTLVNQLGFLSISYKYIFLLITALILYFIVIRSYWAIFIPLLLTFLTVLFVTLGTKSTSTFQLISGLNVIGIIGLLISLAGFFRVQRIK